MKYSLSLALILAALIKPVVSGKTIFEIVEDSSQFDTLELALELTDLDDDLDKGKDLTVFAPKDSAFDRIDDDTLDCLLEKRNRNVLKDVLLYHVLDDKKKAKDFKDDKKYNTLLGESVKADVNSNRIKIVGKESTGKVVDADIIAENGVVHVINRVLIPDAIDDLECDSSDDKDGCKWRGRRYDHGEWYDRRWKCVDGDWKKYDDSSDDRKEHDCKWRGRWYDHGEWYDKRWKCVDGDWKKYDDKDSDDDCRSDECEKNGHCYKDGYEWGDYHCDHGKWVWDDKKGGGDKKSKDDDYNRVSTQSDCTWYPGAKKVSHGTWHRGEDVTCYCNDGKIGNCRLND